MRYWEFICEGGWETKATQSTVITPATVKLGLSKIDDLIGGFNGFLSKKGIPEIRVGAPTGSSAYHDVDPEDQIYGDIDLQIVVPQTEETIGKTTNQMQDYWYKLLDEYIKSSKPDYVRPDSKSGHPIVGIGDDKWVQVDLMPHPESMEKWGRYRVTPERGVKGLLMGNMFSVLGELLKMSIQHAGVQFKVRDRVKQPYATTKKDYELVTLSTDIETFVKDIFDHEYSEITGRDPKTAIIDPMLTQNPGVATEEIKISRLVAAVKGLAKSFAANDMYGQGDLAGYSSESAFVSAFQDFYEKKAVKEIMSPKRDKAETPEAKARAEQDKQKVAKGLEMVKGLFK